MFAVPYALKVPVDNTSVGYDASGRLTVLGDSAGTQLISAINNGSGTISSSVLPTLDGDVAGPATANRVTKIQNVPVASPSSGSDSGKYLQYNGSSFVLSPISGSGGGTVTSVAVSSPLVAAGNTGVAPTISLPAAATNADGYLASTDWNTFNGKQDILSAAASGQSGYLASSDWALFNGKQPSLGYTPLNRAGDTMGGNLTLNGATEIRFAPAGSSSYYAIKAPSSLAANISWTLPTTDGTGGQFLSTNGSGALTWTTHTSAVTSVAGHTGTVTLSTADVSEGSNLYYTDARSRAAISRQAPLTYNSSSGVLGIDAAALNAGGYLTSADWSAFNAKQASLPESTGGSNGYLTSSDWIVFNSKQSLLPAASSSQSGYLAVADWNAFNSKQTALGYIPLSKSASLSSATSTASGILASSDWAIFNSKQPSGNYITALTGDISAAGPGSVGATVNSVGGSSAANIRSAELAANAATENNTASAIVKRDASGNLSAGTITASLTGNVNGNATTATTAENVTGVVAVANGGTGSTSLSANHVLLGAGASALQTVSPGSSGNVLTSDGNTWTSTALPATSWATPGNIGSATPASGAFISLSTNAQKYPYLSKL